MKGSGSSNGKDTATPLSNHRRRPRGVTPRATAGRLGLPYLVVLALLATSVARPQSVGAARGPELDQAGHVVRDEFGELIVYSREELAEMPAFEADSTAVAPLESTFAGDSASAFSANAMTSTILDLAWRTSIWGTNIGRSGMEVVDLDGDGSLELVMATSLNGGFAANDAWMVVRHRAGVPEYDIVWPAPS